MAAGVVTVGGRRYAVGLYWENSPGSGRVAQIAKEAANQPGMQADFYVVRPGNKDGRIPQFGLCSSEEGQKAGMPVLAGCLGNQIPGSWAGAFRLNEGVVVTVLRDDLIVPDGDVFFADEAEARDRLIQEIGFGGLQATYAPESWSIPGADTIPLTLLLNNRQDIKLQQVSIPKKIKIAAAIVALVFVIIIGGVWYWQEQVAQENEMRANQEAALRRAQQALLPSTIQQTAPEPKYDRVWEKAPEPILYIESCRQALGKVSVGVSGWKISTVKCAGNALSIGWSRDKGVSAPPPDSTVNDSGTQGSSSVALTSVVPRGPEALVNPEDVTKRYLAQNWLGSISRGADDPLPPPPPGYTGPWNPPPPPWVKRSFTVNVSELPSVLPDYFGGLPGVVINGMTFNPSGATGGGWIVDGVIYENRK